MLAFLFNEVTPLAIAVIIGWCLNECSQKIKFRNDYIRNAEMTLLLLRKQWNIQENIKKHFQNGIKEARQKFLRPYVLNFNNIWLVSKKEVSFLNNSKSKTVVICNEIIDENSKFHELLLSLQDYVKEYDAIIKDKLNENHDGSTNVNQKNKIRLDELVASINSRIDKSKIENIIKRLCKLMNHKYWFHEFPNIGIRSNK